MVVSIRTVLPPWPMLALVLPSVSSPTPCTTNLMARSKMVVAVSLVPQVEERTWQALVAYRAKTLGRELDGQGTELDAAEDHLVR